MTGVLAFFCNHNHTIITIKDATLMSQSFTSMDAGTQGIPIYSTEEDNDEYDLTELARDRDEYGEYEILEHEGHTVKHYIASGTLHSIPKDTPVYPEPEGDPSY